MLVSGGMLTVAAPLAAHLDRDFRAFASTTPTAYFSERVTFVQDAPADAA